jgi:hypothetical protein
MVIYQDNLISITEEKIFSAKLKGRWVRIGFTVENSEQVEGIFRDKNLLGSR